MSILNSKTFKSLFWWFSLIVISIGHAYLLWDYLIQTTILSKGVCCDLADATFIEIFRDHNQGGNLKPWELTRGWLPLIGKWVWEGMNHSPRSLLAVSAIGVVAAGAMLACAVTRLGCNRWLSLLAPILLPMAPVVAFSARRWDMHGPSLLLLSCGLWLLACSQHFNKILPSLGFAILSMSAAFFSPRETDNILLLLGLGSMALGFGMAGLINGRWKNKRLSRLKTLYVGVVVASMISYFVWTELQFTSPTGAQYYIEEAGHSAGKAQLSWNHPKQIWGYVSYLFWRGWGDVLALPAEIALLWLIFRRRMPVGVLLGLAIPLVILSVMPKKNFYYTSVVWLYPALIIPLGLSALPRRLGKVLAVLIVFIAFKPYWARAYPASELGMLWRENARLRGGPTYDGILQTSDQRLSITPTLDSWPKAISERLKPLIPNDGCRRRWRVMLYGVFPMEELQIRLAAEFPCVDFQCDPPYTDLMNAGIVMLPDIGAAPLSEAKAKMLGQGMVEHSIVIGPDREKITIYRRPDKWFIGRGSF